MREELAVVAPRTLDGVQESEELQDEKEEKEEGSAIDETDETTNERTTEDGESGAAAGSSSSPTLKVGVRVVHETLGQCVITAMGDGTLHGNKKLELEFEANGAKRRKWVDKSDVCVQVRHTSLMGASIGVLFCRSEARFLFGNESRGRTGGWLDARFVRGARNGLIGRTGRANDGRM